MVFTSLQSEASLTFNGGQRAARKILCWMRNCRVPRSIGAGHPHVAALLANDAPSGLLKLGDHLAAMHAASTGVFINTPTWFGKKSVLADTLLHRAALWERPSLTTFVPWGNAPGFLSRP